jgi:hypothetical protein
MRQSTKEALSPYSFAFRRNGPNLGWRYVTAFAIAYSPRALPFSPVAQQVEQAAVNRWVAGSNPARGATISKDLAENRWRSEGA